MLLFAAILMADECHQAKQSAQSSPRSDPAFAEVLEKVAERLESCAARVENGSETA
jgi:hypothetical protein